MKYDDVLFLLFAHSRCAVVDIESCQLAKSYDKRVDRCEVWRREREKISIQIACAKWTGAEKFKLIFNYILADFAPELVNALATEPRRVFQQSWKWKSSQASTHNTCPAFPCDFRCTEQRAKKNETTTEKSKKKEKCKLHTNLAESLEFLSLWQRVKSDRRKWEIFCWDYLTCHLILYVSHALLLSHVSVEIERLFVCSKKKNTSERKQREKSAKRKTVERMKRDFSRWGGLRN